VVAVLALLCVVVRGDSDMESVGNDVDLSSMQDQYMFAANEQRSITAEAEAVPLSEEHAEEEAELFGIQSDEEEAVEEESDVEAEHEQEHEQEHENENEHSAAAEHDEDAVADSRSTVSVATALDLDTDSEVSAGVGADLRAANQFVQNARVLDVAMDEAEAAGEMDAELDDIAFLQQQIHETQRGIEESHAEAVQWAMIEQHARAHATAADEDSDSFEVAADVVDADEQSDESDDEAADEEESDEEEDEEAEADEETDAEDETEMELVDNFPLGEQA